MPVIAALTKTENGYSGIIRTLTLDAKISIDPVEKTKDSAPDFRVFLGRMEIGAGWKKEGRESGREYVSVKLDDPSFPKAINASLFDVKDEPGRYVLVWDRDPNG